jgi:hypothetical protein
MTSFPRLRTELGDTIGELHNVPHNVSFLGAKPGDSLAKSTISLRWYEKVRHVSITNFQGEEYYEDYFMTTTYSSSMQELQKSQIQHFIDLSNGNCANGSLIEVGCGDGSFLNHATGAFKRVVGIEPSSRFAHAARAQGHEIIEGYVQEKNLLTIEKFDYFASRQVFEHLPDPLDCLRGVSGMLNLGAIGFIEVPNGYKALSEGRYFEFFPDHVNYYSVNSLVALATEAGFNVISCAPSFNGDYLELWVSLDSHPGIFLEKMHLLQMETVKSVESWNVTYSNRSENVIFGCGAKTLTIVAQNPHIFDKAFQYAIDSDPNKIGKYLPDTSIEILSITDPRLHETRNVWIMALSYIDEIANLVRSSLENVSQIITLDRNHVPKRLD